MSMYNQAASTDLHDTSPDRHKQAGGAPAEPTSRGRHIPWGAAEANNRFLDRRIADLETRLLDEDPDQHRR